VVSSTPDATDRTRGASIVRKPTRSPTHASGRKTGPWLEKMSRNGTSPARIASTDDAKPPSSKTRERFAKNAGRRMRTATTPRTVASTRQCAKRARTTGGAAFVSTAVMSARYRTYDAHRCAGLGRAHGTVAAGRIARGSGPLRELGEKRAELVAKHIFVTGGVASSLGKG